MTDSVYQVVIADWAIPPGSVIALEHVRRDGKLCLVHSTTLPFTVTTVNELVRRHEEKCV